MPTQLVTVTLTRPADTTQYAANDGVTNSTSAPTALTFSNALPAPGVNAVIRTAKLRKSTNVTTVATFRLWLFKAAPTPPNDNAAYSLPAADSLNLVGYIDFSNPIAGTDCVIYTGTLYPDVIPFTITSGRNLRGILQATGAYAPGSAETFTLELGILQD